MPTSQSESSSRKLAQGTRRASVVTSSPWDGHWLQSRSTLLIAVAGQEEKKENWQICSKGVRLLHMPHAVTARIVQQGCNRTDETWNLRSYEAMKPTLQCYFHQTLPEATSPRSFGIQISHQIPYIARAGARRQASRQVMINQNQQK